VSDKLQSKIKEYEELEAKIAQLKSRIDSSWWTRLFKSSEFEYLCFKRNTLYESIEASAHHYLLMNDSVYAELSEKNQLLLSYKNFQLKVYAENADNHSYTEKRLEGIIRENGYLYIYVLETYVSSSSFSRGKMSIRFKGSIDHKGYCLLGATEQKDFFPVQIPELLEGSFSADGGMEPKVIKSSSDVTGLGYIEK
jgi:hypothetical protein